ncbi:MAG: hypothetical protein R3B59_09905 [Dehalococcoidia bacterium]
MTTIRNTDGARFRPQANGRRAIIDIPLPTLTQEDNDPELWVSEVGVEVVTWPGARFSEARLAAPRRWLGGWVNDVQYIPYINVPLTWRFNVAFGVEAPVASRSNPMSLWLRTYVGAQLLVRWAHVTFEESKPTGATVAKWELL